MPDAVKTENDSTSIATKHEDRERSRTDYFREKILRDLKRMNPAEFAEQWSQYIARLEARQFEDPLTGLFTRRGLEIELGMDIERARRKRNLFVC